MKNIILTWIAAASLLGADIIADGKGFYPVMVQVVDATSGAPIKGAKVRLEGCGPYKEQEIDPKRQMKILPDGLGKPVLTNDEGVAVVFGYGGWVEIVAEGKSTVSQALEGAVIVERDNKEIFRTTLKDWAAKNHYQPTSISAPWIIVSCP